MVSDTMQMRHCMQAVHMLREICKALVTSSHEHETDLVCWSVAADVRRGGLKYNEVCLNHVYVDQGFSTGTIGLAFVGSATGGWGGGMCYYEPAGT